MANCTLNGVEIRGIASAVPQQVRTVEDDASAFGGDVAAKTSENTGVFRRHIASTNICTSDLCFSAAEGLMENLGWDRGSIDALIFVSQTPDYILPATSCSLHRRLKLATACAALDVNLGCSGYIYGLWLAAQTIASGSARRVLLLAGDTTTRFISPSDRSVVSLFGDAGTATALESSTDAAPMLFHLGTDGRGENQAIIRAGGFRHPRSDATSLRTLRRDGNTRSDEDLSMDGTGVFAFMLREVPPLIRSTLEAADWSLEDVDALVIHQANRFMLQYLIKSMRLPAEKVVFAMQDFGNTSSASVPLAITTSLADRLGTGRLRLLLASFGNGFSWGAVALECGPITIPAMRLVADEAVA